MIEALYVVFAPIGAIVAGKNDQGVFGQAQLIQRSQDLAYRSIHLLHKIPVFTRPGLARIFRRRHPGRVRCGKGDVQEKGFLFALFFQKISGFFHKAGQNPKKIKGRRHGTLAPKCSGVSRLGFVALGMAAG